MSYLDRRLTSLVLSLFNSLEANTQTKSRVVVATCGMLATIGMWFVHLSYPYIFHNVIETDSKILLLLSFAIVLAPPFAAVFSIACIICPQACKPDEKESGPMSGYFYRERADKKWKIAIVGGLIAGMNFLFMLITSHAP